MVLQLYLDDAHLEILQSTGFIKCHDGSNEVWIAPSSVSAFGIVNDEQETDISATDSDSAPV